MVPIYDSDIAEERWSKTEWNHYELWERVEQKIRRHNRLWILATAVVFLLLSSVPVVMDQRPHWIALSAARKLGQEIDLIKRDAATQHAAFRLRFLGEGNLAYEVDQVDSCDPSGKQVGKVVSSGNLVPPAQANDFRMLGEKDGEALSVPGLLEGFCYDPLKGSVLDSSGRTDGGFAIAPVKDLARHRLDRIAVLLVRGPSANVSFE